jgi:hypothetical protein
MEMQKIIKMENEKNYFRKTLNVLLVLSLILPFVILFVDSSQNRRYEESLYLTVVGVSFASKNDFVNLICNLDTIQNIDLSIGGQQSLRQAYRAALMLKNVPPDLIESQIYTINTCEDYYNLKLTKYLEDSNYLGLTLNNQYKFLSETQTQLIILLIIINILERIFIALAKHNLEKDLGERILSIFSKMPLFWLQSKKA